MKTYFVFLFFMALLSCNDHRSGIGGDGYVAEAMESVAFDEVAAPMALKMAAPARKNYDKSINTRKLIKNGTLHFETADIGKTKTEIENLCALNGAYISLETQRNPEHRLEYHQEIRVPAANFEQLLQKIEKLGARIEMRTINTQDVTEEFIDLEARLRTKKELEVRYRELLKLGKTVKDILEIETQMGDVRAEIESMEGRLNYLNNQVTYGTLSLMYFETVGTNFGFTSKFALAIRNGWENLLAFLIGVTALWPFILLALGMVWLVLRWRRKSHASTKDEAALEVNT